MTSPETNGETDGNQGSPSLNGAKSAFIAKIWEWARVIVIALAIAIPVRFFIAEPFIVNGPSMDPTFSSGQFLIVDRLSYRFTEPARGDVIVFKYPFSKGVYYIKRIVGLPGERLRVVNGQVSVENASGANKRIISEPYVQTYHASKDTLIMPSDGSVLKADEYAVLGDNRLESYDSRSWGMLGRKYIVGRPIFRITPLTAISIYPGQYHEATSSKQ